MSSFKQLIVAAIKLMVFTKFLHFGKIFSYFAFSRNATENFSGTFLSLDTLIRTILLNFRALETLTEMNSFQIEKKGTVVNRAWRVPENNLDCPFQEDCTTVKFVSGMYVLDLMYRTLYLYRSHTQSLCTG